MSWDEPSGWQLRALRHGARSRWSAMKSHDKQIYQKNAYRILLTLVRKGMVIFVPGGDVDDATNSPAEFEVTAQFLLRCGVTALT